MTSRIVPAGDATLILELSAHQDADADVNACAVEIAVAIRAAKVPGVLDVVPTFRTVGVYFDPLRTDADALSARLNQEAVRASDSMASLTRAPGALHRIPVCYGGTFGPDLAEVASAAGLTEQAVVSLHAGPLYRVFMLGFIPGFAYLGLVPRAIAVPRRATPRASVPSGSVGIAGTQTGIYPTDSPGGWNVIGRTPIRPFDPGRDEPFLFRAGDSVRFYAIEAASYGEGC